MNQPTCSSLSPTAVLLAAACFGIASLSAQPQQPKTTANDPLGTVVMPMTTGNVAPGSSAIPATETSAPLTAATATTKSKGTLHYSDKRFVMKVAEGCQLEIALAKLAAERTADPAVRSYARQLVTDHTELGRQLNDLAALKGLQADLVEFRTSGTAEDSSAEWNDPSADRHYRRLALKSGAEFDQTFVSGMVSDHEDDIAMFAHKAEKSEDADVRAFATAALPTLRLHLERAEKLDRAQRHVSATK
ncbi:MAG: DUF4142 domain-containing protein [Verrucomicrobia bacterium]|nr:DUF4142 domain-containing protein [Verrucomicrobiota bacterium]